VRHTSSKCGTSPQSAAHQMRHSSGTCGKVRHIRGNSRGHQFYIPVPLRASHSCSPCIFPYAIYYSDSCSRSSVLILCQACSPCGRHQEHPVKFASPAVECWGFVLGEGGSQGGLKKLSASYKVG
jgi:hypothetical protein